jgi:hypothetical protein
MTSVYFGSVIPTFLGLSLLQNGPVPRFLEEDDLQKIFFEQESGRFNELRKAFKDLGIFQVCIIYFWMFL